MFMTGFLERALPAIFFAVAMSIVVTMYIKGAFKSRYNKWNKYVTEDRQSNTARKQEVEKEFFYTPNTSILPIKENAKENIKKLQDKAIKYANNTMLVFPSKRTNVELKFAYGPGNLEKITAYEENYQRYTRALVEWAEALLKEGNESDAIKLLEISLEMGSEFRKTYTLLADYYADKGNMNGINNLQEQIKKVFLDDGIRNNLINRITQKKSGQA